MEFRTLGRTGLQVSALGLGGNQFGDTCDEKQTGRIVATALECGVNFIDTADGYSNGASELLLGKALVGKWDDVVLATKTGMSAKPDPGKLSRRRIVARLEASLRRLGTDHVDLYYFHWPDDATPLEESLRAVEDLIRAGKVRYLGVSNHPAWQVAEMIGIAELRGWSAPVACQMQYNMLERTVEKEVVPACLHFGVSLVPYLPLAGGFLTGKYKPATAPAADTRFGRPRPGLGTWFLQDEQNFSKLQRYDQFASARARSTNELAIAWLLANKAVCSVIAGATDLEQVAANARAVDWTLSSEEIRELA